MARLSDAFAPTSKGQLAGVGWSPERAADVLGVTASHVRDLARAGELVAVRERRRWYLDPASVRSYLARQQRRRAQLSGGRDD